jgi:alpha-L-rhamnosidase
MAGGQVSLAWTLYEQYGDRTTLAAHFAEMKRFVDTNVTNHPDHIWPADHGFGDWCPPDQTAGANGGMGGPGAGTNTSSEVSIVNTALSYKQAADVAKAATALGYPADAAHYAQVAADIKNAFNARFGNAAGNGYGSGRQTTSILPLAFGMVPDDMVQAVGAQLVDTILHKNGGHLDTGIFGTRYLVDALAAINRIDIAMTVLNQTSYPGFGFQIGKGATTSWEQWLYSAGMQTHDHAMFAGINWSLYTQLAGITPASPGYQAIAIRPQVPDSLDHVAATLETVRGTVGSTWTKSASAFRLTVTIPVNATATVHVPLFGHGADRVAIPDGAVLLKTGADDAVYSVDSGRWTFSTRLGA